MVMNSLIYRDQAVFTASTDLIDLTGGRFIDHLNLAYSGESTDATLMTTQNMMNLAFPIEVFLKGSPVIQISGEDLCALNELAFGKTPTSFEGTAATDSRTWISTQVQTWQPPRVSGELNFRINRTAVTSCDTELLSVTEWNSTNAGNCLATKPKYLHYVTRPMTTAGAAGFGNLVQFGRLAGELEGILIRAATIPTATAEVCSFDNVDIYANDVKIGSETWFTLLAEGKNGRHGVINIGTDDMTANTSIQHYVWIDFSLDPIPRGTNVRLDIDSAAPTTAVRATPVMCV